MRDGVCEIVVVNRDAVDYWEYVCFVVCLNQVCGLRCG